jgi:choline dehydrogenase-like flavoprotein
MKKVESLVIGSGPGGAVTAWELKKNDRDVLLLEAGSNYELASCKPYSTLEMEQKYKFGGLTPTFNSPKITYVEGGCLGGGSEVNSGFYHRAPDEIIKSWSEKYKIENFSTKVLSQHFERIEKEISVSFLPNPEKAAKASIKLKEGAENLGWKNMEVPRWFKFINGNDGIKQSMTRTYVKWYLDNGGELLSNQKAIKFKRSGDRWIVFHKNSLNGEISKINARYVFLCGGAISTPFLLRSSGIKKNIGNTLQMHPTVKVVSEFDEIINFKNMGVPVHQVKEFSPRISIGCSISSKKHLALAMLDNSKYLNKVENNWEKMAIYYAMIIPEGRGSIRKLPFFNDPFVQFRLSNKDLINLSDGLKIMCELLFSAGAKNIFPSIRGYGPIKNSNDIKKIPKILSRVKSNLMTIHLFSSCPMGEDENICATNSYGKIFGEKNLFVNDGSLMPSAPGVNPQGTIMAIARRNIYHFLNGE